MKTQAGSYWSNFELVRSCYKKKRKRKYQDNSCSRSNKCIKKTSLQRQPAAAREEQENTDVERHQKKKNTDMMKRGGESRDIMR